MLTKTNRYAITAEGLTEWVEAMKAAGRAMTEGDCATALGVSHVSFSAMKRAGGADLRTAMACAAILAGLPPFAPNGDPIAAERHRAERAKAAARAARVKAAEAKARAAT